MAIVFIGRVIGGRCLLAMENESMTLHDEALYPSDKIRADIFAVVLKAVLDGAESEWISRMPGATCLSELVNLELDLKNPGDCKLTPSALKDCNTYGALFFRIGLGRIYNNAGTAAVSLTECSLFRQRIQCFSYSDCCIVIALSSFALRLSRSQRPTPFLHILNVLLFA